MRINPSNTPVNAPANFARPTGAGVASTRRAGVVARLEKQGGAQAGGRAAAIAEKLIAGRAPGGVDFNAEARPAEAPATAAPLPLYRHPADRNEAATTLQAGRIIDVTG